MVPEPDAAQRAIIDHEEAFLRWLWSWRRRIRSGTTAIPKLTVERVFCLCPSPPQ